MPSYSARHRKITNLKRMPSQIEFNGFLYNNRHRKSVKIKKELHCHSNDLPGQRHCSNSELHPVLNKSPKRTCVSCFRDFNFKKGEWEQRECRRTP
mmetsp:Transcript_36561/g.67413  ORF Transcript_36561/g.67413 Transcript_36561/m.67413 type:complete len:96 (-) Transcript_36561:94-381(-)